MGELEVCDQGQGVLVGGVVLGVEQGCPELVGFFDGFVWLQDADLRYAILNGRGVIGLVGWPRQRDLVGGGDAAAAVDKFSVDVAILGCAKGQEDLLVWFTVVGE